MSASNSAGVCVVGAGQAAAELVAGLRQEGYQGPIALVGDEPWLPYQRPPLSKASLVGELAPDSLLLRKADFYERNGVTLHLGRRVVAADPDAHQLRLDDDRLLAFESLVFAVGGHARQLSVDGAARAAGAGNWHTLRNIADLQKLKPQWVAGARVAIVGGGYIGLEVASSAIKSGLKPTVLEGLPRVLARVTAPEVSAFYERVHREAGVDLRTGVAVQGVNVVGDRVAALLTSAGRIEADLFIVGVGLVPNTVVAAQAGLDTDNGIVVDAEMRTRHPRVFAIGDCAAHPNVWSGTRIRIESVPNAIEQARVAAAAIAGKPRPYEAAPWFWSDQYDLKLQMVGLSQGYEQLVLRGDPQARSFMALYLRGGQVIAADAISRPGEFLTAKRLVAGRIKANPEQLADEAQPLKALLSG
jgi:3-phenylpropionate/trans-cinnamate dioxygenase ferredoxin reductase subunit